MSLRKIPAHSIGRIYKKIEDIRVSGPAIDVLKIKLEEWASQIALRSLVYMKHAKRKTILIDDVELALKDLFA